MTPNPLYKNDFIKNVISKNKKEIKILIELDFKNPKVSFYKHYYNYIKLLGFKGLFFSGWLIGFNKLMSIICSLLNIKNFYSLNAIAKSYSLNYIKIDSVNSENFSRILKLNDIDYVINSGNQIYGKNILREWKGKIINRHSSFLPKYGGIYPIFWQLLNGEKKGGVTLHWIDERIDQGSIAYQGSFNISHQKSLFFHYKLAFELSEILCNKLISDLKNGVIRKEKMIGNSSYYSWPKYNEIVMFKKVGCRIV